MIFLSFRDLQNYTTLKLHLLLHFLQNCFRDLQNYTTLKLKNPDSVDLLSFRDLQNYTTLKHLFVGLLFSKCFRDLQNYTTLKPQIKFKAQEQLGLPPGVILYSI